MPFSALHRKQYAVDNKAKIEYSRLIRVDRKRVRQTTYDLVKDIASKEWLNNITIIKPSSRKPTKNKKYKGFDCKDDYEAVNMCVGWRDMSKPKKVKLQPTPPEIIAIDMYREMVKDNTTNRHVFATLLLKKREYAHKKKMFDIANELDEIIMENFRKRCVTTSIVYTKGVVQLMDNSTGDTCNVPKPRP